MSEMSSQKLLRTYTNASTMKRNSAQKAQSEAMKDQSLKIDNIDRSLAELKGMVRMLVGGSVRDGGSGL